MAEKVAEHDFIELNYSGKLIDGTVFDTTNKTVAEENKIPTDKRDFKPAIICVGEQQILPGLDKRLIDKEIGTEFTVHLAPEDAFGKRDIKKMKIIPSSTFKEHKMQPQPGLQIDVDGEMGTVTKVSGGRIIVNFNHPLAGREVSYQVNIIRKLTDTKEKISSYLNATLRLPFDKISVEIKEDKAEVGIPMDLPPQFVDAIGKNLAGLVGVKEISFKKV
jgi:FKBP-type peptidyl-prolyl cis-trans isomerase 2